MNHTQPFYKVGKGTSELAPDMFDTKYIFIGLRLAMDGSEENVCLITAELQSQVKK
ncbi:hypothetical protein [Motilimonas pumila]|uniref:hypothetical protein n=1 Tax=Motilimonas pumila TaxID=2303987 RepID=UPI0013144466|nr:hypothetical protein [Motilimonas pumila]